MYRRVWLKTKGVLWKIIIMQYFEKKSKNNCWHFISFTAKTTRLHVFSYINICTIILATTFCMMTKFVLLIIILWSLYGFSLQLYQVFFFPFFNCFLCFGLVVFFFFVTLNTSGDLNSDGCSSLLFFPLEDLNKNNFMNEFIVMCEKKRQIQVLNLFIC